jgi:hypothetical protein
MAINSFIRASLAIAIAFIAILLLGVSTAALAATPQKPAIKTVVHGKAVTESVIIDAPPEAIFDAIRKLRSSGPGLHKLVSFDGKRAVVEERFWHLPILGTAICTYEELEQPFSRIDYKMLNSDKLKRFEGFWLLSPEESGRTLTTLSLLCDPGISLPFADQITASRTRSAVSKKLTAVKAAAEKSTTMGN